MTARSIRRAAERKAAKLARKQAPPAAAVSPAKILKPIAGMSQEDSDFVREIERELTEKALSDMNINPATPQTPKRCTGPITAEGKAISSLNRLKHGLTGTFRVLEFESQNLFDELRDALRNEHAPATATETILVDRMAEHVWLSQRAQRLQDDALFEYNEKTFALYLRYQTTNDRAFHKCLRELATMRRERQHFESQNASEAASQFESQKENAVIQPPQFESQPEKARPLSIPAAANGSAQFESQDQKQSAVHHNAR